MAVKCKQVSLSFERDRVRSLRRYMPHPPRFSVCSRASSGTGASVTAPVAVNILPLFVTKISNDFALSRTKDAVGRLKLITKAVLAPFSMPKTRRKEPGRITAHVGDRLKSL